MQGEHGKLLHEKRITFKYIRKKFFYRKKTSSDKKPRKETLKTIVQGYIALLLLLLLLKKDPFLTKLFSLSYIYIDFVEEWKEKLRRIQ